MLINELKDIAREYGVVGAGGAGFPSYAKMTEKADTVILNCVECEPLLKLHRQLLAMHAEEIIQMLDEVRETLGAKEAVIGVKDTHVHTISFMRQRGALSNRAGFPLMKMWLCITRKPCTIYTERYICRYRLQTSWYPL